MVKVNVKQSVSPYQMLLGSKYNTEIRMSWGKVISHNKLIGAVNIELTKGFTAKNIQLSGSVFPGEGYGEISYPPIGTHVRILHPKNDIKNGIVLPAPLNYRDESVKTTFLDPGTDIKVLPGGWKTVYDQETGDLTITNGGSMSVVLSVSNGEIQIQGADDYAVAFNDLKAGFDQLVSDFNALVNIFNAHVHSGVTTGGGSSGTSPTPGSSSAASVDDSKIDSIRVP